LFRELNKLSRHCEN